MTYHMTLTKRRVKAPPMTERKETPYPAVFAAKRVSNLAESAVGIAMLELVRSERGDVQDQQQKPGPARRPRRVRVTCIDAISMLMAEHFEAKGRDISDKLTQYKHENVRQSLRRMTSEGLLSIAWTSCDGNGMNSIYRMTVSGMSRARAAREKVRNNEKADAAPRRNMAGVTPKEAAETRKKIRAAALNMLRDGRERTSSEIAEKIGKNKIVVGGVLANMRDEGLLRSDPISKDVIIYSFAGAGK